MASSDHEENEENAFEAFGQRFLAEFAPVPVKGKRKANTDQAKRKNKRRRIDEMELKVESDEKDDWEGVQQNSETDGASVANYASFPYS